MNGQVGDKKVFGPVQQIQWLTQLRKQGILAQLSGSTIKFLISALTYANNNTALCFASRDRLMRDAGIGKDAHGNAKKQLAEVGLIEIVNSRVRPNCIRFHTLAEIQQLQSVQPSGNSHTSSGPTLATVRSTEDDEHVLGPRLNGRQKRTQNHLNHQPSQEPTQIEPLNNGASIDAHSMVRPSSTPRYKSSKNGQIGIGRVTLEDLRNNQRMLELHNRAAEITWVSGSMDEMIEFFAAAERVLRMKNLSNPPGAFITQVNMRRWDMNCERDRVQANARIKKARGYT